MTASDIVTALEAGLITENEAVEQGMVERLSDLYGKPPHRRALAPRPAASRRPPGCGRPAEAGRTASLDHGWKRLLTLLIRI